MSVYQAEHPRLSAQVAKSFNPSSFEGCRPNYGLRVEAEAYHTKRIGIDTGSPRHKRSSRAISQPCLIIPFSQFIYTCEPQLLGNRQRLEPTGKAEDQVSLFCRVKSAFTNIIDFSEMPKRRITLYTFSPSDTL